MTNFSRIIVAVDSRRLKRKVYVFFTWATFPNYLNLYSDITPIQKSTYNISVFKSRDDLIVCLSTKGS